MRRPLLLAGLASFVSATALLAACSDDDAAPALADAGMLDRAVDDARTVFDTGTPDVRGDATSNDGAVTDASDGGADAAPRVGADALNPGLSCLDVLTRGGGTSDGVYWLQPPASAAAFQAVCDMTTDTGGWTLIANYPLGSASVPAAWSTSAAEGAAFHDMGAVFKLDDARANALKTSGWRVRARASKCLQGACTMDHTLYFKPACVLSSTGRSTPCSTAYLDPAFTTLTPSGAAPNPCAQHGGLIDNTCGVKGGVVTHHNPAFEDAGIFLCVGELTSFTRACMPRGDERSGVQIWVR